MQSSSEQPLVGRIVGNFLTYSYASTFKSLYSSDSIYLEKPGMIFPAGNGRGIETNHEPTFLNIV